MNEASAAGLAPGPAMIEALADWIGQHPAALVNDIIALYRAGQFEAADTLAAAATGLFPAYRDAWFHCAMSTLFRGDFGEAAHRFAQVRERFPDWGEAHAYEGMALRKQRDFVAADARLEQAIAAFPTELRAYVEYAWSASDQRDLAETERRCALVLERFPDRPEAIWLVVQRLLEHGRLQEGEAQIVAAYQRFPDNVHIAWHWALSATVRKDWPEADRRWEIMRARYPDTRVIEESYARMCGERGAVAHYGARRMNDLQAAPVGIAEFPGPGAALRWLLEDPDGDPRPHHRPLSRALLRPGGQPGRIRVEIVPRQCRAVAAIRDGGDAPARSGDRRHPLRRDAGTLSRRLGRLWLWRHGAAAKRADGRRRSHGRARHGAVSAGLALLRRVRPCRRRPQDAARAHRYLWEQLRDRFPSVAEGHWLLAHELNRAGQLDRAEAVIAAAFERHADNRYVLWQWARSASARRDWADAQSRLDYALARHPEMPELRHVRGELRIAMQFAGLEEAGVPAAPAAEAVVQAERLLLRFEALGDNCEFGIIQRAAGLEPLGLLRWANITCANLTEILNTRFAGVGEAANTRLDITAMGEYGLVDTRYFGMHTFINAGQTTVAELMPKMLRRLRFLKDKLIEDLTEGEKIFLHKNCGPPLSRAAMQGVLAAMRRYGPCTVLFVQRPPDPGQDHRVERLGKGLLVGYLSRLTANPIAAGDYVADWAALCQAAERLAGAAAA